MAQEYNSSLHDIEMDNMFIGLIDEEGLITMIPLLDFFFQQARIPAEEPIENLTVTMEVHISVDVDDDPTPEVGDLLLLQALDEIDSHQSKGSQDLTGLEEA